MPKVPLFFLLPMHPYRYMLQPYGQGRNTRFTCPGCQKKKQFTRYIDTQTGEHLHEQVGSCNRKSKCGYHYTPRQYWEDHVDQPSILQAAANQEQTYGKPRANALQPKSKRTANRKQTRANRKQTYSKPAKAPISLIPREMFYKSRRSYEHNCFTRFLTSRFGNDITEKLIACYHIGTSKKWPGATVFWQIDQLGRIRAGKIMLYDQNTGNRVKQPFDHITWTHSVLKLKDYQLCQCLYGEHLLKQFPGKPVAVVESEKTAIICAIFLSHYLWLATGSKGNLSRERCQVLKGRHVTLFPDLKGYEDWSQKAKEMADIASFTVSDILERMATEEQRNKGLDLADFLLQTRVI